ncbi:threonine-phosphate decarboxylase [Mesorhizobium sp. L-8-10]|uniref:threonine-phosphate decarboxylase CobD n=1 Tax=Mesorhizobium sp. L-8-10 TaxID=2744523 RepID=UPI001928F07B|nr:threonine-phosphate decarboxylase CobD [Mesorhizobium sp. L-8-10]BCH35427.1 threonine-phosphate decarboxylase [Mesorhizobium sp. L-8-10]
MARSELFAASVVDHGGSLVRARALFPQAREPWIDLSTGINPHSYPFFDVPATAFTRLPEASRAAELAAVAARAYGVPAGANVVPAPGTQILLPRVAALVPAGRARVLSPTYAEHCRAAALAGHDVSEVTDFDDLFEADLAVLVNPNNPDGRVVDRARLLALAEAMRRKGGLLVVDEAFMDVGPTAESVAGDVEQGGPVVLRSFGKFFGLAGLRLGFAVAAEAVARQLAAALGPWAVAGPALEYGIAALADTDWQNDMRARLEREATALDGVLARHGLPVSGGTSLFRFLRTTAAAEIFDLFGRHGILIRNFAERPHELRIGLPGSVQETNRIEQALRTWSGIEPHS